MSGRTRIQGLLGVIVIALLGAAVFMMVKHPGFFGEEAALDRLFKERPEGFAACLNIDTFAYDARIEEDGPYSERRVAINLKRVPLAASGGKVFYRFELDGGRSALFATFAKGDVVHLYRQGVGPNPAPDDEAMVLAFSRARGDGPAAAGLTVNQRFPSSGPGTLYVHGHFVPTGKTKQTPEEVVRCVQSSEEEEVRQHRMVELPVYSLDQPAA